MKILLTGVTGYIGGRLISKLLEEGHSVRVLVRDPSRVADRPWSSKVEIVSGDLVQNKSLQEATQNIDVAYYLVHSMLSGADFENLDRRAAQNFVAAAQKIKHVIYLGGLVPKQGAISHHLKSRAEVGQILRDHVPTTEFRAGPIIGSGSASFEMLRYLTERLPIMIAPRWIINQIQPVAVRDVLSYLIAALKIPPSGIVDIGADRLTFKEMMHGFADVRGLRRSILPIPILAPALASRWVGLVTPIPNAIATPLIEGIIQPLVADTTKAETLFPFIKPIPYKKAVALTLMRLDTGEIESRWSDALNRASGSYSITNEEGMIREVRSLRVKSSPATLFRVFSRLGGSQGWLTWNWAWKLRGLLDRILGGPGLRRGRRHATEILTGDAIDFWRVEALVTKRMLRLRAEMKVPGRAWIEWEAIPTEGGSIFTQTASFAPKGLAGTLYWYSLYPIHRFIFSDLAQAIAKAAEQETHE